MGIELRLPQINGKTDREQLAQIKSYLYQMAQQLQWALNNVSASSGNVVVQQVAGNTVALPAEASAQTTFNAIKSMIIKSADIVNAYSEEISRRLGGEYVARSDFGSYTERTTQEINESSTEIERLFTNVQTILTDIETMQYSLIETNAHIHSGLLYYDEAGIPIYGLEIGQRNEVDGEEVFNKYARFISDRLSFYDQNDNEVAYISDYKLYITHLHVTESISHGGFVTDTSDGIAIKWEGGDI